MNCRLLWRRAGLFVLAFLTQTALAQTAPLNRPAVSWQPAGSMAYVLSMDKSAGANPQGQVQPFSVDAQTGTLTPLQPPTVSAENQSMDMVVTPPLPTGQRFAYVANPGSSSISRYQVDANSGVLTALSPVQMPNGQNPYKMGISPLTQYGYYLYVLSKSTNGSMIEEFNIVENGALNLLYRVPVPISNPAGIVVSPSGNNVYALDRGDSAGNNPGTVSAYSVNPQTQALTLIGTVSSGYYSSAITVSPAGQNVYVLNEDSSTVSIYMVNIVGQLISLGTATTGPSPIDLAVSPDGKRVFVTNSSIIYIYKTNSDGTLLRVGTSSPPAGNLAGTVTVSPSGQYVYSGWANSLTVYSLDTYWNTLTPLSTVPVLSYPRKITFN